MAEPTLFDEASLALIASGGAGKDGKVYSIKPVPEYGPEKVTNGDFATDSNWTKGNGATISGGKANIVGDGSTYIYIQQNSVFTTGRKYRVSADVEINSGLGLKFQDGATNENIGFATSSGTYVFDFTAGSNTSLVVGRRTGGTAFNSSVDNISVKEISNDGDFAFSRGSNLAATRVGPDGLIEKGRENVLLQSNQFDTTWVLSPSTTITSGQSGYDGTNDAWLFTKDNTQYRALNQNSPVSGICTLSLYAKAGTLNQVTLRDGVSQGRVEFNLSDGSVDDVRTENIVAYDISSVGNDWYRCQVSFNGTAGTIQFYADFGATTAGNIYIQDAQLEQGLVATDYIESGASTGKAGLLEDEPRFDYSGGATCPSLLLEPSRTNIAGHSEYHSSTIYGNQNVSIADNAAISPEGLNNAAKIILDSGTNTSNGGHSYPFNSTAGTNYTVSVFAKAGEYRYFTFTYGSAAAAGGHFDLQEGTLLGTITNGQYSNESASIEDYGNGWYRLVASVTDNSSVSGRYLSMKPSPSASVPNNNNYSSTGDGISGAYIYGFQLEANASYPTSYIPNHSGGTITRGADVCGDAGDVNTFNSTEGVLYLEASALDNGSSEKGIALNDGGTNNRINIRILNNNIRAYGIVGGSLVCLMTYAAPSVTSINKIAFKYKENDFALWVNGVERVTDNSGAIFPANTLNELSFDYGGASAFFYGKVKQVLVFKEALSDTELIKLTTI